MLILYCWNSCCYCRCCFLFVCLLFLCVCVCVVCLCFYVFCCLFGGRGGVVVLEDVVAIYITCLIIRQTHNNLLSTLKTRYYNTVLKCIHYNINCFRCTSLIPIAPQSWPMPCRRAPRRNVFDSFPQRGIIIPFCAWTLPGAKNRRVSNRFKLNWVCLCMGIERFKKKKLIVYLNMCVIN